MEEDVYSFDGNSATWTCSETFHVSFKPLATRTTTSYSIAAPSHYSNRTFTASTAYSIATPPVSRMRRLWDRAKARIR